MGKNITKVSFKAAGDGGVSISYETFKETCSLVINQKTKSSECR